MGFQKRLWWSASLLSASGTVVLIVLSLSAAQLPPLQLIFWIWPVASVASAVLLMRCYRLEPSNESGFWHLRLEDLLAVTLYAALLLAIFRRELSELFLQVGVPFALMSAVAFMIGLLVAQRKRVYERPKKFAFAFGYGTRALGLFAAFALVAVIIIDGLTVNSPFFWLRMVLFCDYENLIGDQRLWQLALHRMALACLPIGLVASFMANQWIRHTTVKPALDAPAN
jgi:hypothetical protein